MKFAVMSDIHYISRKMIADKSDRELMMKPAVDETAFRMVSELEDVDTILITGDITDSGDRASHLDLIELLKGLQAKGKKVYVTTATHDFHHQKAYVKKYGSKVAYTSSPWDAQYFDKKSSDFKALVTQEFSELSAAECEPELEEACSPEELWELYKGFGRDSAVSVCNEAHAYCVELDEKTRCLMLNDNFRNIEAFDESANYSPTCYKWIKEMVDEAHACGKFIFACTHHPLVPPLPAYKIGASRKNMRSAGVGHTLADIGIPLVFSGHTHFCDVSFMRSDKGNLLCDITTPSVRFYPPQFRIAELDGLSGKIKIESVDINSVDGFDLGNETLGEHIRRDFVAGYEKKVAAMKPPLNKIVSSMCVKHIYPLCRRAAKLTPCEYNAIKDKRIFDLIMSLVLNMLGGDGKFTPDTPTYKFTMGLAATLDSIVEAQPFYDVRKKMLKGYTMREVIEPMLFNNYVPDAHAEFDFTKEPEAKYQTPVFTNNAGTLVMALLCVLVIPFAKLMPAVTVAALPAAALVKKRKLKKNPLRPERY